MSQAATPGTPGRQVKKLAAIGHALRPLAPLTLVTGLAMYGQVSYALAEVAPFDWPDPYRLALAIAIAVAVESIALYVQWHAHDALLNKHTLTAARQRRASYAIAAGVATINYSHFAGPGWAPTPAAVCFAFFSAAGPWLWGLHTRRAQRVQLSRDGQLDVGGAVFSAERYRWFPWRTLMALRWSIDHGVTDPLQAWRGYNAARPERRAGRRHGPDGGVPPAAARPRGEDIHPIVPAEEAEEARLRLAPHQPDSQDPLTKARRLLHEGVGRPTLARELEISDPRARQLRREPHRVEELLARWTATP